MTKAIEKLLEQPESETLEFKTGKVKAAQLGKVVCGMLNQHGGVILWGVDDEGSPTGIADAEARAVELNNFLMPRMNPRPLFSATAHRIRGKEIVAIDIPAGTEKPYAFERQFWVRLGSSTMRAAPEQSSRMVERSAVALDRWEREPHPGFDLTDCDSAELKEARDEIIKAGRFGIDVPAADVELLAKLYLLKSGQLTNAAVVLFAANPLAWAPNLSVRITSHIQGGEATHDRILEGPAIRILREAVVVIQQRTGRSIAFPKGQLEREELSAYPLYSLREGLVNAMVHRDYETSGIGVLVRIYEDRLEIANPGQLPDGWTGHDLGRKVESHPRNPDIARVFYLRKFMDQLGLGTQRIVDECVSGGAKSPKWKQEKHTVTLTLFPAPELSEQTALNPRQMEFLNSLKLGAPFKAADYEKATSVSARQARRDLAELERIGALKRTGAGPSTAYRLTKKL